MVSEILVARHGETDWNFNGKWQGHTDRPLNERGLEQARVLATKLSSIRIDSIYASDLARARTTAEIIASAVGVSNVEIDARLRERNLGSFEGLSSDEICAILGIPRHKLTIKEIGANETIEKWGSFANRIRSAVDDIRARNSDKRVLIVAHGGVMAALSMIILNDFETPRKFTNGEIIRLSFEDEWSIQFSGSQ